MKTVLEQMLDTYETRTIKDKKNALFYRKEKPVA